MIVADLKLKMENLELRYLSIDRFFDTVPEELKNSHIERMTILEMAESASAKALESGIPIEERECYRAIAAELTSQLPHFGEKTAQKFSTLVQALPKVELPLGLLN